MRFGTRVEDGCVEQLDEPSAAIAQGVIYRVLGSWSDAIDLSATVAGALTSCGHGTPPAWTPEQVVTIATRVALEHGDAARRPRDVAGAGWLPEPVLIDPLAPYAHGPAVGASIEVGNLVALRSLEPARRAGVLLHDLFEYSNDQIAAVLDQRDPVGREWIDAARRLVRAQHPRRRAPSTAHRQVASRLLASLRTGKRTEVTELLAPDASLLRECGGPLPDSALFGRDAVGDYLTELAQRPGVVFEHQELNGRDAIVGRDVCGWIAAAVSIRVDGQLLGAVFCQENPDKLDTLAIAALRARQGPLGAR